MGAKSMEAGRFGDERFETNNDTICHDDDFSIQPDPMVFPVCNFQLKIHMKNSQSTVEAASKDQSVSCLRVVRRHIYD